MKIEPISDVTPELVAAFVRLLPQISPGAAPLSTRDLEEIVHARHTILFVARTPDDQIVGSATLVLFRIPSGRRARIESLVVDEDARNQGVGESLCRAAIERARAEMASTVDLTSSRERTAANRLYERLGFEHRRTNVYRLEIAGA